MLVAQRRWLSLPPIDARRDALTVTRCWRTQDMLRDMGVGVADHRALLRAAAVLRIGAVQSLLTQLQVRAGPQASHT